jgi:uncharacterized protein (TIGR03382 family)
MTGWRRAGRPGTLPGMDWQQPAALALVAAVLAAWWLLRRRRGMAAGCTGCAARPRLAERDRAA